MVSPKSTTMSGFSNYTKPTNDDLILLPPFDSKTRPKFRTTMYLKSEVSNLLKIRPATQQDKSRREVTKTMSPIMTFKRDHVRPSSKPIEFNTYSFQKRKYSMIASHIKFDEII